jgi:TonB family protein
MAAVLLLPLAVRIGPGWKIKLNQNAPAVHTGEQTAPPASVVVQARRPASMPAPLPITIWVLGIVAMGVRIALGHWRVRSLFGRAEEIREARWLALVEDIGPWRKVTLKRSTATDVPLSYGMFRATVLLPAEADFWSDERRRIVLTHEMVHAGRLDLLWGLIAQSAVTVCWFHPLAWLAAKKFRTEQERSCDDAVVTAGTGCAAYAGHLIEVARAIAIPEAALGMADEFDLEGRVRALLDPGRSRRAVSPRLCAAMMAGAMALMVPLAAIRAQNPQTARASVAGTVYDPSGAVIPNATISLKNTAGSNEEAAATDAAGRYTLPAILAGDYSLKVSVLGFVPYQSRVKLEAGTQMTVNAKLTMANAEFREQIVAKRPQGAVASGTPQRIRVGGMVQPEKLISKVSPVYPADAQAEGVEGTVVLRAVVSKDGGVLHVTPISNVDQRLVSAAVAAVSLWRYEPTLLNGEPVEALTTITVSFRLN